jgi:hypothetical protein
MSKNFGFVAVGAFGFIAVFAGDLIKNRSWLPASRLYKRLAWIFCIILLTAHIPLAALSRLTIPKITPFMLGALAHPAGLNNTPLSNDSNVVIVNAPCQLSVCVMPFNVAYYGRPIPKSIRALAFAYTGLEIERINNKSLVIRSQEENIFTSNQSSPLHFAHAFATIDKLMHSDKMFEKNRRFVLEGMTVEVLKLDSNNLPKELAFTFDAPLEHERFRWLQFNWYSLEYEPFNLPEVGQTVATDGPPVVRFSDAMRFLLGQ